MRTVALDQETLRTILEDAGLRCTPQRLSVYDHLARAEEHPTAEDIYQAVRAEMPRISLATVYKALEALVEVGVAARLPADLPLVTLGKTGIEVDRLQAGGSGPAPSYLVVTATASDLELTLYHRPTLSPVDMEGDYTVLDEWHRDFTF